MKGRVLARAAAVILAASVAGLVLGAQPAAAAAVTPAAPAPPSDPGGQTPAALSWITMTDSRGISVWQYELSIDRGGVLHPDHFLWSAMTDFFWGLYRVVVVLALWFFDWVNRFEWLHTIAAPVLSIGDAVQSVIHQIGVVPTFLTITAIVAVITMARGRWATGIWDLGMALVIATLATGVFAHPVQLVAGDDGYIAQAHRMGVELSDAIASGGDSSGKSTEELQAAQTQLLVDTFLRQPTQMINFGQTLDGGPCESTYNDVLMAGPYGMESDIRDRVGECDPDLKDYADNPTAGMGLGTLIFFPASFLVLLTMIIMAGSVVAAGANAMFHSVRAIIAGVKGLLPGAARGSAFQVVADVVISLFIIVFTTVFLGVFVVVIQTVFASSADDGDSSARTFVIIDILLVVGIVVFWRQRKSLKNSSARLAEMMAWRPGAPPTRLPDRRSGLSGAAAAAGGVAAARALANVAGNRTPRGKNPLPPPKPPTKPPPINIGDITPRPPLPPLLGPGPGRRPPGPGPGPRPGTSRPDNPTPPPSAGRRTKQAAGTLVRAGTSLALAYATGGTSTAAQGAITAARAARAIESARRAAVVARLATAAGEGVTGVRRPQLPVGPVGRGRPQLTAPPRVIELPSTSRPTPPAGRTGAQGAATGQKRAAQTAAQKAAARDRRARGRAARGDGQ